jgi:hypothetical protein
LAQEARVSMTMCSSTCSEQSADVRTQMESIAS